MVRGKSTTCILLILLLAGLIAPIEGWTQLRVQAVRDAIGINESLQIEIILEDGDPDSLDLTPLERDFEIVAHARGSQVNIINGSMSKINTWSLRLLPKHSGTLTLPQLCAASSCSDPITIEVSDAPPTPAEAQVILEHGSVPERVYVGQQILYPLRLLYRTPVQQAALDAPRPEGVDAEVLKMGEDRRRETYRDGWRYDVIERLYAIIPSHSGTLHIPPVSMDARIQDGGGRGLPRDLFDPFGSRAQLIRQRTAAVQIVVEPPARTEHPWLPAQALELHDSWGAKPPQLRVGEPVTRTITIHAQGTSAEHLPEITLQVPAQFKLYPDQPERENIYIEANGINAQLRQSGAIVPRTAGTFTLPEITLHWWDLRAQRWSTARIEAKEVKVLPSARVGATGSPAPTLPPAPQDGGGIDSDAPDSAVTPKQVDAGEVAVQNMVPTSPPRANSTPTYLWAGLTIFCAMGWCVTLGLWWRARTRIKKLHHSAPAVKTADSAREKRADIARNLLNAAQQHDVHTTRQLLHQWATALYPASSTPLDTLCHAGDAALRHAIAQLNAALYSGTSTSWDGTQLAAALRTEMDRVQHVEATDKNKHHLPPLYPHG